MDESQSDVGLELPRSYSKDEAQRLIASMSCNELKDSSSSTEFSDSSSEPSSSREKMVDPATLEVTYWSLVRDNRPYRLYLASYITNYFGVWLTYLSSLTAIHYIHTSQEDSLSREANVNTAISYLVVVRLMTNFFVSPFGGIFADAFCRRKVMILLDLLGALSSIFFMLAIEYKSINMIYFATFLQQVFGGLYEPSRSALLPLLTNNDDAQMQKATILSGMAWSAIAALGSSLGGFIVSVIGLQACFVVDSLTYLVSAYFMFCVGEGQWNVSKSSTATDPERSPSSKQTGVVSMLFDMGIYLSQSFFAPLILMKFSTLWMTLDVVNVAFAEGSRQDESAAAYRIGLLFGAIGIGCFVGPVVAEQYSSMERPTSLQLMCVISLGISAVSCLAMGIPFIPFWLLCLLTAIRASGVSAAWINSSLIMQKFCIPEMLGRVTSVETGLALVAESLSATGAGVLLDYFGFSPSQVCLSVGILGTILFFAWGSFHALGKGAAMPHGFMAVEEEDRADDSSEMRTEAALHDEHA